MGVAGLRGTQQADQLAGTILAELSTKRGELVVAAMVALAVARWDSGRAAEALDLAAQAVRQATDRPYETTHFSPHMFLASALIQVRRLGEATAITDAFEVGGPRPEGITEVPRARIALAAGRLDDAVALAESASRRVKAGGRGFRGELARRVERPVRAEDYQVAIFEREGPPGEAVRLTRMEVKSAGVADVVDVYGDTAVPWLADTPGFRETLLFADPADGQLISQTGWRGRRRRRSRCSSGPSPTASGCWAPITRTPLTSRNNLASAYRAAGRTAEAIPLFERTLADRERVLGADHPDTLASRNIPALAYQDAGGRRRRSRCWSGPSPTSSGCWAPTTRRPVSSGITWPNLLAMLPAGELLRRLTSPCWQSGRHANGPLQAEPLHR